MQIAANANPRREHWREIGVKGLLIQDRENRYDKACLGNGISRHQLGPSGRTLDRSSVRSLGGLWEDSGKSLGGVPEAAAVSSLGTPEKLLGSLWKVSLGSLWKEFQKLWQLGAPQKLLGSLGRNQCNVIKMAELRKSY